MICWAHSYWTSNRSTTVDLLTAFVLRPDFLAGRDESANRLQI